MICVFHPGKTALNIANYIIENNATVRQAAKKFGISKSIVHTVVIKLNGFGMERCGS